jgi:hypothetical protein
MAEIAGLDLGLRYLHFHTMAVKQRKTKSQADASAAEKLASPSPAPPVDSNMSLLDVLRRQPLWIVLAVASGACAALNGVFAKLYVCFTSYT